MLCGHCIKNKPYFDRTFAPYAYDEPLRTLLHEFKYHQGLYLRSFLANLIVTHLPSDLIQTECLLPVPMHQTRLRQRGFNQAAELTKYIAQEISVPYNLQLCQKVKATLPQAGLKANERQRNVKNTFKVKPLKYKHVTLIDDLLTTGSTANELAKTLKNQGVERVDVWCCARALEDQSISYYQQPTLTA